ncbi:OLC1v1014151C1 [Oldenlandia corymbosa var. corymbosa]|uniref:chitinase n=1 Tax=Oldenlandia corymbosa var. corymbosa TaxID=529605 RepID=A0AAV1E274_OLDCO|nr:OLC1v1014151C1 [Oldenlandia corymbosa var. corymbosa]
MAGNITFLVLAMLNLALLFTSTQGGQIAIYWGQNQNGNEPSLAATCATGDYNIVILSSLTTFFFPGLTPELNLPGHCDWPNGNCTALGNDISVCQGQGVKVFLSLGGPSGRYQLSSPEDATSFAEYLWKNYLNGQSDTPRPLGNAVLDGIDFDIEVGTSSLYWDALATNLKAFDKNVILSASTHCYFPDYLLGTAIGTGLFDYVWVRFYNQQDAGCEYLGGSIDGLISSWNQWNLSLANQIFLGLGASPDIDGYMRPYVLISQVLPKVKYSSKYGGVMLWNKDFDNGYSTIIKNYV